MSSIGNLALCCYICHDTNLPSASVSKETASLLACPCSHGGVGLFLYPENYRYTIELDLPFNSEPLG